MVLVLLSRWWVLVFSCYWLKLISWLFLFMVRFGGSICVCCSMVLIWVSSLWVEKGLVR